MRIKILCALFLLFLFPVALKAQNYNANVSVQSKQEVEKPKTAIFGRAVYEDTGKPVRRGAISLLKIPTREVGNNVYESLEDVYNSKTITNENGEFRMEGIEAGEYYPYMDVAGVLNPNTYDGFYMDGIKISNAKLNAFFEKVTVIEGVKELPVLIRVKRGGAIGGRVSYADGEPAVNIKVEVLRKGDDGFENKSRSTSSAQQTTDDRGIYRFAGLPPGEYTVRIIEPANTGKISYYDRDDSLLKTYYGDTAKSTEAKTAELALGEEKSDINITIPDRKTFKVSGVIVAKSNKKPIKNARVTLSKTGDEDNLSYRLRTNSGFVSNEKGEWSAIDLPAGTYTLTIYPPEEYLSEEELKKRKNAPQLAETKTEIELEDKDLENLVLELPLAAKISGTVVFEDKRKVENLYVYIYDEETQTIKTTGFNSAEYEQDRKAGQTEWNFVFPNVPEGKYFINVSGFTGQDEFYVKSIKSGNADLEDSTLQLKEAEEIKNVQIVLATDVGTLKGKIEISDPKALMSMRVVIFSVANLKSRNLTQYGDINENGEFQFKAAPGEYFLVVQPASVLSENSKLKYDEWVQKFTKDAERVKIKSGETQTVTVKKN